MAFDIDAALRYVVEREGSDLHVKVASPPMARMHGALRPIEGAESLTEEDTQGALEHILTDEHLQEEFARDGEADSRTRSAGCRAFGSTPFASAASSRSPAARFLSRCGRSTILRCPR